MLLEHGLGFVQRRCTCNLEKERDLICAWTNGIAHNYSSLQAIEFYLSSSAQADVIRPGTGPGYENTEPGCIYAVPHVPFIICLLRSADAKCSEIV